MRYFGTQLEDKQELEKELVRLARKSRFKRSVLTAVMVCILLILAVAAAWLYGRSQTEAKYDTERSAQEEKIDELEQLLRDFEKEAIVVNPVAPEIVLKKIQSEVKDIGELATVEYLFTDAAKFTDSKQLGEWTVPWTEKSFMLKWDGVIKAGVDVNQITFQLISSESGTSTIRVCVPKAKILSYEIDDSSVEKLDESNNIFNPITVADKIDFDSKNKEAMKERAVENGLLEKAQENAEQIISNLLTGNAEIRDQYLIEFVLLEG